MIVSPKAWQIYDAGDFSLLCTMSSRPGETWRGGDFLATDRVIAWNNKGIAYIYRLPTKYEMPVNDILMLNCLID